MSITDTVRDHIAHATEHGHAITFPQPLQDVLHAIAEHVDHAGGGFAADPEQLKPLLAEQLQGVNASLEQAVESISQQVTARTDELAKQIDRRIEEKFAELLSKAAAAEKPADTPPQQ